MLVKLIAQTMKYFSQVLAGISFSEEDAVLLGSTELPFK